MKLGVNIDHIATIRQARKTFEPDPVRAAVMAELAGADSIVIHLREDRRHINDNDVQRLKKAVKTRFNLEMSIAPEIVEIACLTKPHQATLVPEKREELTTEGGLDIITNKNRVKKAEEKIQEKNETELNKPKEENQIENLPEREKIEEKLEESKEEKAEKAEYSDIDEDSGEEDLEQLPEEEKEKEKEKAAEGGKGKRKIFKLGIIGLAVLMVLGGGFFGWRVFSKKGGNYHNLSFSKNPVIDITINNQLNNYLNFIKIKGFKNS